MCVCVCVCVCVCMCVCVCICVCVYLCVYVCVKHTDEIHISRGKEVWHDFTAIMIPIL